MCVRMWACVYMDARVHALCKPCASVWMYGVYCMCVFKCVHKGVRCALLCKLPFVPEKVSNWPAVFSTVYRLNRKRYPEAHCHAADPSQADATHIHTHIFSGVFSSSTDTAQRCKVFEAVMMLYLRWDDAIGTRNSRAITCYLVNRTAAFLSSRLSMLLVVSYHS